jgi:hypothetical protein
MVVVMFALPLHLRLKIWFLTLLTFVQHRALLLSSLDLNGTGEVDFSEFESIFGNAAA